jgi:DNA-binding transcriptional MocR family regulator
MWNHVCMNFPDLQINGRAGGSRYLRLAEALAAAVACGDLPLGVRLPSERDLAARLGVSRTTVASAYREIESRGLVRGHVGRGTFVCAGPEGDEAPFAWRGKLARGALRSLDPTLGHLMSWASNPEVISFAAGVPALDRFPTELFAQLTAEILRTNPAAALGHGPSEGQPRLRAAIARRFGVPRERVLVLTGAQQGLDLVARCMLDPGDAVVMDRPGYLGAIQAFRAAGAHVVGWDVLRADMGELEDLLLRYRPKLIYTNPSFQNPTGRTLPLPERQELLALAARYRTAVIEDGTYEELYFTKPPPPPLYHLDRRGVVIHVGSFSKMLAPGLRLGWLVAAEAIVGQLALVKQRTDAQTANLGQLVVAELIGGGRLDEHVRLLRAEHARRLAAMEAELERALPQRSLSYIRPEGGMYLWCRLPARMLARDLLERAIGAGIAFVNGDAFYTEDGGSGELRLCFAGVPAETIRAGVRKLAAVWEPEMGATSRVAAGVAPVV